MVSNSSHLSDNETDVHVMLYRQIELQPITFHTSQTVSDDEAGDDLMLPKSV